MNCNIDAQDAWTNWERIDANVEAGLITTLAQASLTASPLDESSDEWQEAPRRPWRAAVRLFLLADAIRRSDEVLGRTAQARVRLNVRQVNFDEASRDPEWGKTELDMALSPECRELRLAEEELTAAETNREQKFERAYMDGLRGLFQLPAPDVFGVRLKIELWAAAGLNPADGMDDAALQILQRDFEHLAIMDIG